jgi:hypothetical protein
MHLLKPVNVRRSGVIQKLCENIRGSIRAPLLMNPWALQSQHRLKLGMSKRTHWIQAQAQEARAYKKPGSAASFVFDSVVCLGHSSSACNSSTTCFLGSLLGSEATGGFVHGVCLDLYCIRGLRRDLLFRCHSQHIFGLLCDRDWTFTPQLGETYRFCFPMSSQSY